MSIVTRRHFLLAAGLLGASSLRAFGKLPPELLPPSDGRRVVIVGGGWGGLAAARHLRRLAPELDVVLIERQVAFRSLPLSSRWLVGHGNGALVQQDIASAARHWGYRAIQAEVQAIDRERRRIHTDRGSLDYDWLILAAGIRQDYGPWFGDDVRAAEHSRTRFPGGFLAAELPALKQKLAEFRGGELLMTVPPAPCRCPPAPYERAVMIAWYLKTRGIRGRLVLVDPSGGMARFNRLFAERYKDQILHLTHATVRSLDPFGKTLSTDVDDIPFDDALLAPPQQAADLLWQADLIGRHASGTPTGWAAVDSLHLHVPGDERVFLVGDLLGQVSPLFGMYPKSAHMAFHQGRIVAEEIAARAGGRLPGIQLPETVCHVHTDLAPEEMLRIEGRYRQRGDGLLVQTLRQVDEPQPRGEEMAWARGLYSEFLAP